MVKQIIGKCAECGKDIVLIMPETEEEFKEWLENEDVRGYRYHIAIPDLLFHTSCQYKMHLEGRWKWDSIFQFSF